MVNTMNVLEPKKIGIINFYRDSCVRSGDLRVNSSPALMALHTLFLREHNRLAGSLLDANPLWDDDTIFQEARRIVSAEIQHITYREFLPAILGENLAENLKLTPQVVGHFQDYDIDAYPGTLEAAASAALSFGVAMLPSKFDRYNTVCKSDDTRHFGRNQFFRFSCFNRRAKKSVKRR